MNPIFFNLGNNFDGHGNVAAELQNLMPVNVNTSLVTLTPALVMVEKEWILPVLGKRLFDRLAAYYKEYEHDVEDKTMDELLQLVQMAEVRLAIWDSYDQLRVNISDAGAVPVVESERRLYRYENDELRRSLEKQGFRCLDNVARFCDEHIDTLPEFEDSEYYSTMQHSVIKDRLVFDKIVPINKSAVVFNRIRPFITETEKLELGYRLGKSLSDLALSHSTEPRIERLADGIMGFVAHYAMANAGETLNIIPTELGLMQSSEVSSNQGGAGRTLNAADKDRLNLFIQRERERAERCLSSVMSYIKKHLDEYPEASEIGGIKMPVDDVIRRNNKGKRSFFM